MVKFSSANTFLADWGVMSTKQTKRPFRSSASLEAEQITRDAVEPFLTSRGFIVADQEIKRTGTAIQQFVLARTTDGPPLKIRIRLCWRKGEKQSQGRPYSAAQLRARIKNDDWIGTLDYIVGRDSFHGVTHNLFVQPSLEGIEIAALVPSHALKKIWIRQRDISTKLQRKGLMGKVHKNHAMNGSSPTIWLQDDRTPDSHQVPDALWSYPGVIDLVALPIAPSAASDDTYDDCPGIDFSNLGSDGSERRNVARSEVKRDPKVRRAVIARAQRCERPLCEEARPYGGFLDVHHILGVGKSDRVWNCVALCPNCHREAHISPDAEAINEELLLIANKYKQVATP
jgi:5-methylcytosine-specific restriction enzyme A